MPKKRNIAFVYSATGEKLRKTLVPLKANGQIETQEAIDVTDYMGEYIYRNNVLSRIINTEGACVRQSNGSFVYEYDMKDHLGNTRVTFSDVNNDWTIDPNTEVSQINHYYPYGLNMVGNWNGQVGANKYQYNGKEWNDDFGLGWNDYGARMYDPAVGRWWSVDPLSERRANLNTYHYVLNNPIRMIDPDGMTDQSPNWLSNALQNAWNATPENGRVDFTVSNSKKTDAEKATEQFGGQMADARAGAAHRGNGVEFGFLIFKDLATGSLYSSCTVESQKPKQITTEWDEAMLEMKEGSVIAGVYHTHPFNDQGGTDNPFSDGDMNGFLMQVGRRTRNGSPIGDQYFSIVDSKDNFRYIASVNLDKKGNSMLNIASNFANGLKNGTPLYYRWTDTDVSRFHENQWIGGSMSDRFIKSYEFMFAKSNSSLSITKLTITK